MPPAYLFHRTAPGTMVRARARHLHPHEQPGRVLQLALAVGDLAHFVEAVFLIGSVIEISRVSVLVDVEPVPVD